MWPDHQDALSRTIESEQAVEDLYAEALRRWAPTARAAALPTLTAAAVPPDPDAVAAQQATEGWSTTTEVVVVAGLALLWAACVIETFEGLGLPLPPIPPLLPTAANTPREVWTVADMDRAAVRAVLASTTLDRPALVAAHDTVEATPVLREARDVMLDQQRQRAAEVPREVAMKVDAAVALAAEDAADVADNIGASEQVIVAPTPDTVINFQRQATERALDPAGEELREIARTAGYQAAAVQNHAIVTTAVQAPDEDPLDKVWIATIDGKTRPSHWAADGQRAPLVGTFSIGGAPLAYPGDPAGPAREVKNCRCRVGVLAPDEALPDEVDRHTERLDGRDSVQVNREGSQQDEIERRERRGNVRARDDADGIGRTASGGWAAPSEQEMTMADDGDRGTQDETGNPELFRTFSDAVLALVGVPTSDGRMLATDIDLSFRTFPQPLMWCKQSNYGHLEAYTVGVIESATYDEGKVTGSGYMLNSPEAEEAAEQLAHGVTGPSVDLAATEWVMTDKDGKELTYDDLYEAERAEIQLDVYQTVTKAELIGATLVATPAFGDTTLSLNSERESRDVALVASAAEEFRPRVYAAALFSNPQLTGPTRTTITEDGRIFGHLACFGECHRSIQAECVVAPRSRTDYGHFHTSPAVRLDDGTSVPVGRLTVGTGHAGGSVSGGVAAAHYDNTGTCWALVRVGEDAHGVWFSGVAAPWATPEQIEMGLSAPLSGDWRDFGGGLELVAALAVNTPGFTARGYDDEQGRPVALVASLQPAPTRTDAGGVEHLTLEGITAAVQSAVVEAIDNAKRAEQRNAVLARAAARTTPPTPSERIGQLLAGRELAYTTRTGGK